MYVQKIVPGRFLLFSEMGFGNADLKLLCYEALKEVFPGNLARDPILKTWNVISSKVIE